MANDRWDRLAPLVGVAAVILIAASIVITSGDSPSDFPGDPNEIVDYFEGTPGKILAGAAMAAIGSSLLLLWAATLRSRLPAADGDGRLSSAAFAGAVATAVIGTLIDVVNAAGAFRADEEGTIDTAV